MKRTIIAVISSAMFVMPAIASAHKANILTIKQGKHVIEAAVFSKGGEVTKCRHYTSGEPINPAFGSGHPTNAVRCVVVETPISINGIAQNTIWSDDAVATIEANGIRVVINNWEQLQ